MLPPIHYVSAAEALAVIQSGHRVFVHGSAQTPSFLMRELAAQKDRLQDVELVDLFHRGLRNAAAQRLGADFVVQALAAQCGELL